MRNEVELGSFMGGKKGETRDRWCLYIFKKGSLYLPGGRAAALAISFSFSLIMLSIYLKMRYSITTTKVGAMVTMLPTSSPSLIRILAAGSISSMTSSGKIKGFQRKIFS